MSKEKNETKTMVATLIEAKKNVTKALAKVDWAGIYYIFHLMVMSSAYIIISALFFFGVGAFVPGIREALPNFFLIVDRILYVFNEMTGIGMRIFMR